LSGFPLRSREPHPHTLAALATALGVGAPPEGSHLEVSGIRPLDQADAHTLGLLSDPRYLGALPDSRAGALLVGSAMAEAALEDGRPALMVSDPHRALRKLLDLFHPQLREPATVHPTAVVDPTAVLAPGVRVAPYAVIEAGVQLGEGVLVGAHVVVGAESTVGAGTELHPHVVVYPRVQIGSGVVLKAGARIGSEGFGFVFEEGEHRPIPHLGGCVLEDGVSIGANSCVDRGSIGETRIGAGTKIDNQVHIGHNTTLGPRCLVVAQAGISGSTRLGAGVIVGGQVGIAGHLTIGDGARLAAQAGIIGDVPPGATLMGFPARPQREFLRGAASQYRVPELLKRVRALEARLGGDPGDPASGS
jgi:UDP-3-O-[3-hydroxymyristoyl] glucosamine N-acyltransferase